MVLEYYSKRQDCFRYCHYFPDLFTVKSGNYQIGKHPSSAVAKVVASMER